MVLGRVIVDTDRLTVCWSTHAAKSAAAGFAALDQTVETFAAAAVAVLVLALVVVEVLAGVLVGIGPLVLVPVLVLVLAVPRNHSAEVASVADGISVLDEQIVSTPAWSRHAEAAVAAVAAFVVGSSPPFLRQGTTAELDTRPESSTLVGSLARRKDQDHLSHQTSWTGSLVGVEVRPGRGRRTRSSYRGWFEWASMVLLPGRRHGWLGLAASWA